MIVKAQTVCLKIAMICKIILAFTALFLSAQSAAHHSVSAQFDQERTVELEGEIVSVSWTNPHVRLTIRATADDNEALLWIIESTSVSTLRRMDITDALVNVGDQVRLAGNPSRNESRAIYINNLLLPDGREVVLTAGTPPRWSNTLLGRSGPGFAATGEVTEPARGIFRVWSTPFAAPMLFPENVDPGFDMNRYPLTAAARAHLDAWDQATDNPTLNCTPKGMPAIMEQPFPMEFVDTGERILLRLEEYDLVRTIYLTPEPPAEQSSTLGYSRGHWEGASLVVSTDRINWRHFDTVGIPLGDAARVLERFTPTASGDRLNYEMTVTDAATFTEPVTLAKYWVWVPGVEVGVYDCVVGG